MENFTDLSIEYASQMSTITTQSVRSEKIAILDDVLYIKGNNKWNYFILAKKAKKT
jgi:hypothetical protein